MNPPAPPASATPPSGDDARLEQMLRETSQTYLDDDGFTARVLVALPPERRRTETTRRALIGSAGLLGTVLTFAFAGPELIEFSQRVAGCLVAWGAAPVPGLGPTFTVASLAVVLAVGAGGWWSRSRSR